MLHLESPLHSFLSYDLTAFPDAGRKEAVRERRWLTSQWYFTQKETPPSFELSVYMCYTWSAVLNQGKTSDVKLQDFLCFFFPLSLWCNTNTFFLLSSPISPWYRVQVVAAFFPECSLYPRKVILDICIKVCAVKQTIWCGCKKERVEVLFVNYVHFLKL